MSTVSVYLYNEDVDALQNYDVCSDGVYFFYYNEIHDSAGIARFDSSTIQSKINRVVPSGYKVDSVSAYIPFSKRYDRTGVCTFGESESYAKIDFGYYNGSSFYTYDSWTGYKVGSYELSGTIYRNYDLYLRVGVTSSSTYQVQGRFGGYDSTTGKYWLARLDITYSYQCEIASKSASASPTSLTAPGSVTFTSSASCNDSSCGSITTTYSISGAGASASGTGTSRTVTLTSAGTCTATFSFSGCDGDSATASATCTLAAMSHTQQITKPGDSSPTNVSQGSTYTSSYPGQFAAKYVNTWGSSSLQLKIEYKKSTSQDWLSGATSSSTEVSANLNISEAATYDVRYLYGSTVRVSFQIKVNAMSESGTVDSHDVDDYTSEPYIKRTGTSTSASVVYNNTWGGSAAGLLKIVVDDVVVATSSSSSKTSVSYSILFSESSIKTVQLLYNEEIYHEFQVQVVGILTGNGYFRVNGEKLETSINVPQFYANTVFVDGIDGADENTTYTWTILSPTDTSKYTFTADGDYASLTPKDANSNYTFKCVVTSYGTSKTVSFPSGVVITCSAKTVAYFTINRHEGEVGTVFQCYDGEAIAPTATGQVTVTFRWTLRDLNNIELGTQYYHTVSGGGNVDYWNFDVLIPGSYYVVMEAVPTSAYSSYETGSTSEQINVARVISADIPFKNKTIIVLKNGDNTAVVRRAQGNVIFKDLQYSSGLNGVGKSSFSIIGANNITNKDTIVRTGTEVIIVDNMLPVWTGVITGTENQNINTYNKVVTTEIVNIECGDSIKELSFDYIEQSSAGTQYGNINQIAKMIIPTDVVGDIGSSNVNYTVSLETASRLQALDSLSAQLGWRYRTVPNVVMYYQECTISTQSSRTVFNAPSGVSITQGDVVYLYDIETSQYCASVVYSVSSGLVSLVDNLGISGDWMVTVGRRFKIDYKPSYYQEYVPISLEINNYAQDVSTTAMTSDKFGEVSVYGIGYSGEVIASNMRAWMKINKNYTIDNSMRISTSYDTEIDTVSKVDSVIVGQYTWARYSITTNGWAFPVNPAVNHPPTIFYTNIVNGQTRIRKLELHGVGGVVQSVNRFKDHTNTKKTSFIAAYPILTATGEDIPSTNRDAYDEDGKLLADVLASLVPMTNIIFNTMVLTSDKPLLNILPAVNNYIRIGDMRVKLTERTPSVISFDWILPGETGDPGSNNPIPHGHLTDVLVMNDSGTYNYYNPDPLSPKGMYGDVSLTIQGAEGYSQMEMERLSCRYMQYGSNYSNRGEARVVYNAFIKSDYTIGAKRIPVPGDRIEFTKTVSNTGGLQVSDVFNFELLTYEVSLNSNQVSITFGMPFIEINGILYNMLANTGMSILPSDS